MGKTAATTTVGGKECTIGKFGAEEGWRLIHRLTKYVGPSFSALAEKKFAEGIKELINGISEDDLLSLLKTLTSVVLVDGKKFSASHFADYSFTLEVAAAVIKENFGDFFSQIVQAFGGASSRSGTKADP